MKTNRKILDEEYYCLPFFDIYIYIKVVVDANKQDESISRKEFNDLKIEVSGLKTRMEDLLNSLSKQSSSPTKRKGIDGFKGKHCLMLN